MISALNYFRIFKEYLGNKVYLMFVISILTGFLEELISHLKVF